MICYIGKEKKYVFADLRKFLSPKITLKIGSANRKSAKCHICGGSANLTNYFNLQICGICDLRNLFAYHPPLLAVYSYFTYQFTLYFTHWRQIVQGSKRPVQGLWPNPTLCTTTNMAVYLTGRVVGGTGLTGCVFLQASVLR
jgi:hypothetical protein